MKLKLGLAIALLISLAAAFSVVQFVNEVISLPSEAYASDWTAVFIIDHLRTTGEWPTDWSDLRDEFDRMAVPEHYAWTFDELQDLIEIDWSVDVSDVRNANAPPVHVRLTSGRNVSYNDDPNKLIYEYVTTGNDPHRISERIGEHRERHEDGG